MDDFWEILGVKGAPSRCFGMTFGTIFGDFWGSGEIVRIELSPARELDLEGRTSFDVFFKTCPRTSLQASQNRLFVSLGSKSVQK